ncbi:DNA polymerase I [Mycobacterium phage George]|uniref:DNA polymerase I n=1 Tax=Mycobacterium phage George TaxID=2920883 RepID=G1BQ84_9CAUD|nr:DNA pol [Mycobacterium phage George]AEK32663.1 DNA polymerase I [Mycobacterium phage George]
MKEIRSAVAGQPVVINVVEYEEDLEGFRDFIRGNLRFLGLDSETTGLDIYLDGYRCRTVQFGNPNEAWVVPVEKGPAFANDVRIAINAVERFVLHNASFDLQVFEKTLDLPMDTLWPKVIDTKILAHLVDPRGKDEGGIGQALEDLTRRYIDRDVADNVKTLMADLAKEHKTTKAKIWKVPELIGNERFNLYGGMDPILAARLLQALLPLVPGQSKALVPYEHKLAEICSYIERTGFLLDVDYSQQLSARLVGEEDAWKEKALELGLENINSPQQVGAALMELGVKIKARTEGGQPKVDKVLLNELVKGDPDLPATQLAKAIIEGKKAGKWRKTWVQKFLDSRDGADRCHASINPLRARTARMSITGIPAQTLPSGDWMVRRCFLADDGHLMASVDYQTQELRVLAALSKDPTMLEAFAKELDLHQMTADAADVDRKVGKMANFLTVYGGGPKALAEQANITVDLAKKVLAAFAATYPKVSQLADRVGQSASVQGYIMTPMGRRLPVDPSRSYSALNYLIQSTSRDVTGKALVRLHEAGFTPYLRLPIHDEVLASLPAEQADDMANEIGRIMTEVMGPVTIGTDPEVGGRSWGSLYVKEDELESITDPYLLRGAPSAELAA